ncbi:MAG: hypothetical protein JW763_10885 [candidate division Zixibacteria bacterium]|nr:hypothetical protein [candidate division Zixibacteria bacterium]
MRYLFLFLIFLILIASSIAEIPQLISYQGRITDESGQPVQDSTYKITFRYYNTAEGGEPIWEEVHETVAVKDGLFQAYLQAVTGSGESLYEDHERYMSLDVNDEGEMLPRIEIVSTPYAIHAGVADTATFATYGNCNWIDSNEILYTKEIRGIARGCNNIHLGSGASTIVNLGTGCTTGSESELAEFVTIGGGIGNIASGDVSTISGGLYNMVSKSGSYVGGGTCNYATGEHSVVSGGYCNSTNSFRSIICGGTSNFVSGSHSAVLGGEDNRVNSEYAGIVGGWRNLVKSDYSFILGGYADTISVDANYSYLFGIGSKLTEDSTFMVDLPHIRFGNETSGYEFPTTDGTSGQVLATDGSGQMVWINNGTISCVTKIVTTDYILTYNDYIIITSGTSDINIMLPSAVGNQGRIFIIKSNLTGAGTEVYASGGETLEGSTGSWGLSTRQSITVISDGSNWLILSEFN